MVVYPGESNSQHPRRTAPFMAQPRAYLGGRRGARPSDFLLHDLPAAVGLLAGGAVALLGLTADSDGLLELAAIGAVRRLVIVSRHHRAGGTGLLIAPRQRLAGLAGLERGLRRPVGIGDIGLIERSADLRAQQAAGDDAERGRRPLAGAAAELVAEKAARGGADERAACRLVHADFARRRT